uniref:UBA domain-containing protein n=1 Tax=Hucho hucho TaxID=62062 RepID=A0A4W5MVX7_9TELE
MMTSLGGDKARGTRDKALPAATHTTQPQKQLQATAEQIRLAQMIYDKNDAEFEDKVNQLMEVTGKIQDECMVALHDCNEDVNRAINFLLESTSDTVGQRGLTLTLPFSFLKPLSSGWLVIASLAAHSHLNFSETWVVFI